MPMAQVVHLPRRIRYWEPGANADGHRLPLPYKFTTTTLNCSRPGVHMDKILGGDLLAHLWPWMREGLLHIRQKNLSARTTWLPEHVRENIALGLLNPQLFPTMNRTECFIGHDADANALRGFLVCYPLVDPFTQLTLEWFVWMASIPWHTIEHVFEEFEELARVRGYTGWRMTSPRRGWERRAAGMGAKVLDRIIGKSVR